MNLDQEFHSFGVSETLRRQAVLVHNHRTGMALDVLEKAQESAIRLRIFGTAWKMGGGRKFDWGRAEQGILSKKTKALIEHDRILRGEA